MLTIFAIAIGQPYFLDAVHLTMLEIFIIGIPSTALALEINAQRIQGKFILNVLRNAFSGAIIVLFNVILVYILLRTTNIFVADGISWAETFTTLIVYAVTITGMMMLWKMALPLNVYRGILLLVMTVLVCVGVFVFDQFFGLVALNVPAILLLVIMLQASYPAIAFINGGLGKIKFDKVPLLNKIQEKLDR
jgi:cation-transporting ATPase E